MTINTGPNGCPLEEVALPAVNKVRTVGTAESIAGVESLHIQYLELCGRVCTKRGICLAISQGSDSEVDTVKDISRKLEDALGIVSEREIVSG